MFAVLTVGLTIILMWVLTDSARRTKPVASELAVTSDKSRDLRALLREASLVAAVTPKRILDDYEKYSAYPPNSRPVTPERAAAFKYNHRVLEPLPVIPSGKKDPAFLSEFTADKLMVFGEDAITLTLRASHPTDTSGAFRIEMRDAGLTRGRGPQSAKIAELSFHDDGRGGDLIGGDSTYTAVLRPAQMPALADFHGSVRAFVEYSANGVEFSQQLFFDYYPKSGIAARFTGNFRDSIEDGSLVVYAELAVARSGFYSIDATLDTQDERAFCHARFKGSLDEGTQAVRLLFFGKVIRDAVSAVEASFKVMELYGQMVPAPDRLAELAKGGDFAPWAVPLYEGYYVTNVYTVAAFSEAEWNDPERSARINDYRQHADKR